MPVAPFAQGKGIDVAVDLEDRLARQWRENLRML